MPTDPQGEILQEKIAALFNDEARRRKYHDLHQIFVSKARQYYAARLNESSYNDMMRKATNIKTFLKSLRKSMRLMQKIPAWNELEGTFAAAAKVDRTINRALAEAYRGTDH